MRKPLRYLVLLLILAFVAANEAYNKMRTRSWERPLVVHLFATSGDGRAATGHYIDSLRNEHFRAIENFFNREARRYGVGIEAIEVEYRGRLDEQPPQPPGAQSLLANIWWSLKFRAWALRRDWSDDGPTSDIDLFINYYDIATTRSVGHSVGLQGGLIGIINAFADANYRGSNQVVITHELLHTLGAADKYGANNLPVHPQGYAEPYRQPLYPQTAAEIMGGRIPLSPAEARIPRSLGEVTIGPYTSAEIHWPLP